MSRCSKTKKGVRCLLPADHRSLHVYSRLASKGRRATRQADALVEFQQVVQARAHGLCQAWALWTSDGEPVCHKVPHRGTEAHHVRPRARGGTHDISNGLWLCHHAHEFTRTHPKDAARLGLLTLREVSVER